MADGMNGEPCILLDVVIDARSGCEDRLAAMLHQTQALSRQEDGCLIYRFGRDLGDGARFLLTELWRSAADLEAHKRGAPFAAFRAALPDLGNVVSSQALTGVLRPFVAAGTASGHKA